MKKANFFFAVAVVSTLTFFTSCTAYGPAISHQKLGYTERPFGEKMAGQVYVSGQYGTDATYQSGESNTAGQLGVHVGFNTPYYQATVGLYGALGQYKDQTKKDFTYNGLGFRLHQNIKFMANEKVEVQVIGFGYSVNSERGSYEALRYDRFDSLDSLGRFLDFGNLSVTTGVRYMTDNKTLLGFQYAYGTSGFLIFQTNASHCFTFSGKFDNTTLAINLSLPQTATFSNNVALQPTFSIGLTQGLTKNGF
jgi:hypothetical protein